MVGQPAEPLPPDPERRRGVRYPGDYVVVWDDGKWEWQRCVVCGRRLESLESRRHGYGPSCAAVVTLAAINAKLAEERASGEAYIKEKKRPVRQPQKPSRKSPVDVSRFVTKQLPAAPRPDTQASKRKLSGISNAQSKELARLQRAAGESFSGRGMNERQARAEIERLRRLLGRGSPGMS